MYTNSVPAPSATKLLFTELGTVPVMDPEAKRWEKKPYQMPSHFCKALRLKEAQAQLIQTVISGASYDGCHLQRFHLN